MHLQDSTPAPRFCECGCGQLTPIATRTDRRSGAVQGQRVRFVRYHGGRPQSPVVPRFWSKVQQAPACWLWHGTIQSDGYGLFRLAGRNRRATHIAWEIATGQPVPPDKMIGHTCDTPLCVRNDDAGWYEVGGVLLPRCGHLFLCSPAENMADRDAKGRTAAGERSGSRLHPERLPRGERNSNARLTATDVRRIRALAAMGDTTQAVLAAQFHVAVITIYRVVARRTWAHLEPS